MTAPRYRAFFSLLVVALTSFGCSKSEDTSEIRLSRANDYFSSQQYANAEKEYRGVLRLQPDSPVAQRQLGIIYFDQGQLRQAYPLLKKSSELEPDNRDVLLKLARIYFAGRDYQNARELARLILEKQPGQLEALRLMVDTTVSPEELQETRNAIDKLKGRENDRVAYHLARGAMELRNKDDRQAETDFKAALDLAPKSSEAYSALGNLYLRRQDVAAATQAFETAAALSPLRSPIRLRYAELKLRSGAAAEAKKFVEELVRDAPDHLPGRVFLMKIVCSENRDDDCAARVDSVLAQDSLNYDALFQSGLLNLGKGDLTRAIRIFEQLTGLNDQDPRVRYQLALAYLASMKDATLVASRDALERAENHLSVAVKLDPKHQQAVLILADLKIKKGVPAAAQDLLIPFVKEQPQVARAQYLLGSAYLAQQKPSEALEVYRRMTESFPQDPQPSLLTGRILLASRRPADARKAFEKSLEIFPTYAPAIELLVDLDLVEKQYATALDRVQPLIEKDSNSAQAFGIRGKVYLAQADFSRAEPDFVKAIELDPKFQGAYLLLAQLYVASNRHEQAIAKLSEAIDKNKDNQTTTIPARMHLAQLQQNLKRYDAARDTYEKLLAVSPNLPPALNNLAVLYSENLGQLDKGYDLAKKASEAAPNEPHFADTLGWIEFKRRNYATALRLLQDSAIKLPNSAEIQFHLGMAHYMMGDEASARAALQKVADASADFPGKAEARRRLEVLSIETGAVKSSDVRTKLENFLRDSPNDPVALFRLARLQEQDGSAKEAASTYEKILAGNSNFAPALRQLAVLYGQHAPDDLNKAFEISTRARQTYPDDREITRTLGILNYRRGFYPQAAEQLKAAATNRKDDADLFYYLGETYYQLKQHKECQEAMEGALNLKLSSQLTDQAKRVHADCAEKSSAR